MAQDSLKKVRADHEPQLKDLARRLKVLEEAQPAPTPAPPTPTPPKVEPQPLPQYPIGVERAGAWAKAVWGLKETAGPTAARTNVVASERFVSAPQALRATLFDRAALWIAGAFAQELEDCEWRSPPEPGKFPLWLNNHGMASPELNVLIRRGLFDGSTADRAIARGRGPAASFVYSGNVRCNLTVEDTRFVATPGCALNWDDGQLIMRRCYAEAFGQNTYVDPSDTSFNTHCEQHNIAGGVVLQEDCFWDNAAGVENTRSGTNTANNMWEARPGPGNVPRHLDYTGRRCIVRPDRSPLIYSLVAGAKEGCTGIVRLQDWLIGLPTGDGKKPGYISNGTPDRMKIELVNCFDLNTGEPITSLA